VLGPDIIGVGDIEEIGNLSDKVFFIFIDDIVGHGHMP
jgi:hypothetical protein